MVICFAVSPAWGDSLTADTPDVRVGDMWNYRRLDGFTNEEKDQISIQVVEVSDTEITAKQEWINTKGKALQIFDRQWNFKDNGQGRWNPLRPEYKFPLSIGSDWTQPFQFTNFKSGETFSGLSKAKVIGSEQVSVPAGTYVSFITETQIELRSTNTDVSEIKNTFKVWYAPKVNRAVRLEWQSFSNGRVREKEVMELTKYSPIKSREK